MVRSLMNAKGFAIILALCAGMVATTARAQCDYVPGTPWTVIAEDDLPSYAVDTAYLTGLLALSPPYPPVRKFYPIRFHMDSMRLNEDGKYGLQMARNQGECETVYYRNSRLIIFDTTNNYSVQYSGFRSDDAPELWDANFELDYAIRTSGDTVISGRLNFSPSVSLVVNNPLNTNGDNYGYFIQYVDSIYHPALATRDFASGRAERVRTYPNPASDYTQVELPTLWEGKPIWIQIFDETGRIISSRSSTATAGLRIELTDTTQKGMYRIFVYRYDGKYAVAEVMKL